MCFSTACVKEGTPGAVATTYRAKMSWADERCKVKRCKVFRSTAWQHKRGLLQIFLARRRPTPLLFVLEEDSAVRAPINVAAIHRALLHATGEPVEHVRLNWYDDCLVLNASDGGANLMTRPFPRGGMGGARMHIFDWPCAPHSRSALLHRTFQSPNWNTCARSPTQMPGADRTSAGLQTTLEAAPTAVCLPKVMPRPARRS